MEFLAVVHVSDIPLYLAAGPALDVWSNDDLTEEVLNRLFFTSGDFRDDADERAKPWWARPGQQSDRGILVRVEESGSEDGTSLASQTTELLLYATVFMAPKNEGLPTPPRSSSPAPTLLATETDQNGFDGFDTNSRLYALPLRRGFAFAVELDGKSGVEDAPTSPGKAYFLPSQKPVAAPIQDTSASKRRKISNVFDDATKQRRKLKGRGGEAISRAMAEAIPTGSPHARSEAVQAEHSNDSQSTTVSNENAQVAGLHRRSFSRASSVGSMQSLAPSRPPSRRDSFVPGKRSGLNRVESVVSGPESPSMLESDNSLEQQNRSALSRIVMAGMRMYGLQQKKKVSKQHCQNTVERDTPDSSSNFTQGDPDEYKLVYHQAFKSACFALRTHLAIGIVAQDAMREVVDRLLLLFCTDPLSKAGIDSQGDQVFGSQEDATQNAFDQPSTGVLSTVYAATLSSRKSKHEEGVI